VAVMTRKIRPIDVIGPAEVLTSSELQERLMAQGYGGVAARQAISRAARNGQALWRSTNLQLQRGERLFARASFSNTAGFYQQAAERLKTLRPGLARCLDGLANGGLLNRVHAQRLIAAAVIESDNARSPGFDAELTALRELGVRVAARGASHEYLLGGDYAPDSDTDQRAIESLLILRKECLLARVLTCRLRRQNFVSWNGSELPRQDKGYVTFNGQVFTAYGFSHLAPLKRFNEKKQKWAPCPILIDAFAGPCSLACVQSFLARAENATCWGKKQRPYYVGVIAAREFHKDAWQEAKKAGLLTVNFLQMFGDEALNAMAIVERILGDLRVRADGRDEAAAQEFAQFTEALQGLKANPVVADLCSIGFEVLTGLALRSEGWEGIVLGQDVPFLAERTRDVDVFGRRGDDLAMVECKAYHARKALSPAEVKKFFTETVPACRAWWAKKEKRPANRVRAEIWTSGTIGGDASKALSELSLKGDTEAAICGPNEILKRLPYDLRRRSEGLLDALGRGGQEWTDQT